MGIGHRIYGLVRVSDEKQENSTEVQKDLILKFAETIDGEFAHFRVDEDTSGSKTKFADRPECSKLLRETQKGDAVITVAVSRIGRDMRDVIKVCGEFHDRGVSLYVLNYPFGDGPLDLSSAMGVFLLAVYSYFAATESEAISARTIAGMARLRRKGLPCNQGAPPGFKRVVLRNHEGDKLGSRFVADEVDRRRIRMAAKMHHEGWTMRAIETEFKKRGYKRKAKHRKQRPWCLARLGKVIKEYREKGEELFVPRGEGYDIEKLRAEYDQVTE